MTCASCVGRVERALQGVPGVQSATVNLATESARIAFAPAEDMDARLRRAVRDAGYEPRAAIDSTAAQASTGRTGFAPVGLGLLLSVPLIAPMLAAPFGIDWMLAPWLQLLLAAPVHFGLGARFSCAGWPVL